MDSKLFFMESLCTYWARCQKQSRSKDEREVASVHLVAGALGDLTKKIQEVLQNQPMSRWQQKHQELQTVHHWTHCR